METQVESDTLQAEFDRMLSFAQREYGSLVIHQAWLEYSSWMENRYPAVTAENSLFIPWFLFLWRPNKHIENWFRDAGKTASIVECYAFHEKVSAVTRKLLETGEMGYLSFYMVESKVCFKDLLLDKKVEITQNYSTANFDEGDIVFAIILGDDKENALVGCSAALNPHCLNPIVRLSNWMKKHEKTDEVAIMGISSELFEIYRDHSR